MSQTDLNNALAHAAQIIEQADALLITAGAGMGVDSGLPDFRGDEGFWRSYPIFRQANLSFYDLANPRWFYEDPEQAWGFYGHRLNLYRRCQPHSGFDILLNWARQSSVGYFVFSSNVDGHFQRAGFAEERILECHGSINHLQCLQQCGGDQQAQIWEATDLHIDVDEDVLRARGSLPHCPNCGALARPNILMFGDGGWNSNRSDEQSQRYQSWLQQCYRQNHTLAVIELGAGLAIPTVRWASERAGGSLVRVNPRDTDAPEGAAVIPLGALEALQLLAQKV